MEAENPTLGRREKGGPGEPGPAQAPDRGDVVETVMLGQLGHWPPAYYLTLCRNKTEDKTRGREVAPAGGDKVTSAVGARGREDRSQRRVAQPQPHTHHLPGVGVGG